MWATLGIAVLCDRDAGRLPHLPGAGRSSGSCLGGRGAVRSSRCCSAPPVNSARRWFGVGGLGIQPSELAKLAAIFFIAAHARAADAPHQRGRLRAAADRHRRRSALVGLILLEPDFGTSMSLALIAAVMVFAAGLNYRYVVGASLLALPVVCHRRHGRRRTGAAACWRSSIPWDDPLGDGFQIIQSLIAVGTGGVYGQRADERRAEAVLPAGAAHRLHLFGDLRGARADRRDARADLLLRHHLARPARRAARARHVRRVSRARPDDDGGGAGVREHQRRARPDADQGHSAAVRELRRIVAADQSASAWAFC